MGEGCWGKEGPRPCPSRPGERAEAERGFINRDQYCFARFLPPLITTKHSIVDPSRRSCSCVCKCDAPAIKLLPGTKLRARTLVSECIATRELSDMMSEKFYPSPPKLKSVLQISVPTLPHLRKIRVLLIKAFPTALPAAAVSRSTPSNPSFHFPFIGKRSHRHIEPNITVGALKMESGLEMPAVGFAKLHWSSYPAHV